MQILTPASVVVRNSGPLTAAVDGEVVMLDARQGAYFGLDLTGSAVWELIGQPVSIEAVCSSLVDRFDIDHDACLADVTTFLAELIDAELVMLQRRSD